MLTHSVCLFNFIGHSSQALTKRLWIDLAATKEVFYRSHMIWAGSLQITEEVTIKMIKSLL